MAKRKTKAEEDLLISFERCLKKVREKFNAKFLEHQINISYDQWLILKEVSKNQGIIQRALAQELAKETASISRMSSKLVTRGYITKKPAEHNKKAFKLYLTPEGFELSKRITGMANKLMEEIFNGIYDREVSFIKDIVSRVNKNFS